MADRDSKIASNCTRCLSWQDLVAMGGSFVSSPLPSGHETSSAFSRYILPYQYHPQVTGSIQPLAIHCDPQAGGTGKRKRPVPEIGKRKNRWRAHKKETCQCAVCKQVRGELESTWFNHDKASCKCSVCKQARGEKKSPMKIASAEQKYSLISNRKRRLSGKLQPLRPRSSSVLPGQSLIPSSGLLNCSKSTNLSCEMTLAIPGYQCLGGAGVNRISAATTLVSNSGLRQPNPEMAGSYTANTVAYPAFTPQVKQLMSEGSSVGLPNLTSCPPSSGLYTGRCLSGPGLTTSTPRDFDSLGRPAEVHPSLILSWSCRYSLTMSRSESPCQAPSQVIDDGNHCNSSELTTTPIAGQDSALKSSRLTAVVPRCRSVMNGERLSSVNSSFESESRISSQLTQDNSNVESNSADFESGPEGPHNSSEASSTESSSKIARAAVTQTDPEETTLVWSGESSVGERNKALPSLDDMHVVESTCTDNLLEQALPLVSKITHKGVQVASSAKSRKRKLACTRDSDTCGCRGCVGTFSERIYGSVIVFPEHTSSTLKRRRIFSHPMDTIRPLQEALFGVSPIVSSGNPRASKNKELSMKTSLRLRRYDTNGSYSPATICEQSSYNGRVKQVSDFAELPRSCSRLTTSCRKRDSSLFQTANSSGSCRKNIRADTYTTGFWAGGSLMSFLDQAGQQSRGNLQGFIWDGYRALLRTVERAGGILLKNSKVTGSAPCRGRSALDFCDQGRCSHQALSNRVEMSSQKSADIRIHRSHSALLLGEQPCSLLIVAHDDLSLKRSVCTVVVEKGFSLTGLSLDVREFEFLAEVRDSIAVRSIRLIRGGSRGGHQAGLPSGESFEIYSQDSGNGRQISGFCRPLVLLKRNPRNIEQTFPSCLFKLMHIVSFGGSRSSAKGKADFSTDSRVMPTEGAQPLIVEKFIPVAQHFTVQQRLGDKRKRTDVGFAGAAQPLLKERRFSYGGMEFSAGSSAICRYTPGVNDAIAVPGLTEYGVSQLSVSKLRGELVTSCQGNPSSDDGEFLFIEAKRLDSYFSRQREDSNKQFQVNTSECSAATPTSDPLCQIKSKRQSSDEVRHRAEILQSRKNEREGTLFFSALSVQGLLNYVSQNVSITSVTPGSSAESISRKTSCRARGGSGGCITPEAHVASTETVARWLLDPIFMILSVNFSCSCSSSYTRRRDSASSSCVKSAEENTLFPPDIRIVSAEAARPLRREMSNLLCQHATAIIELRFRDKRKRADLSFDGAVQSFWRQRRLSTSGTEFSKVSSAAYGCIPHLLGNGKTSAMVGSSDHQRSVSVSLGEPALFYGQTMLTFLLNRTVLSGGSCSSPSVRRGWSVTSVWPNAAEENAEFSTETRVMSTRTARSLSVERFTAMLQQFVVLQQRLGAKRKYAEKGFDRRAETLPKQNRSSCSGTEFSGVSSAICQWTPNVLGYGSVRSVVGSSLESFAAVLRQFVVMKQRLRSKRKHADLGFDGAAETRPKRNRSSSSSTEFSGVVSEICQRITNVRGRGLVGAVVGSSDHEVLPLVTKSSRELVTSGQGNLWSDDGKFLLMEHEKPELDLCRHSEEPKEDNRDPQSCTPECSTATRSSDSACEMRAKRLTSDAVRQTAEGQQSRKHRTDEKSCGRLSALSPGLSFQELLNSVSLSLAATLVGTNSSVEHIQAQTKFSAAGRTGGCMKSEGQVLQDMSGRDIRPCNFGEESRLPVSKYEQAENMSLSGEVPRMEDSHEGISSLACVPAIGCHSPKSNEAKLTLPGYSFVLSDAYSSTRERCTTAFAVDLEERRLLEVLNSSQGVQETVLKESTLSTAAGDEVSMLKPAAHSSPILLSSRQDTFNDDFVVTKALVTTKVSVSDELDGDDLEILQTSSSTLSQYENSEFQQKLNAALENPFNMQELEELEEYISVRKPQMRLRESRRESRHVPLEKEGFSYLEHYPEFGRKLASTDLPGDRLKLLRGFFFWVQHTCTPGAFIPWEEKEEEDDCVQIIEEKCTAPKRALADTLNQKREMRGRRRPGSAGRRVLRPPSSMHMSLRARKKTVYTSKHQRGKKVPKELGITKVKAEDQTLKRKPAKCLATAQLRTSPSKEKK